MFQQNQIKIQNFKLKYCHQINCNTAWRLHFLKPFAFGQAYYLCSPGKKGKLYYHDNVNDNILLCELLVMKYLNKNTNRKKSY